jgi:hypothetical protein
MEKFLEYSKKYCVFGPEFCVGSSALYDDYKTYLNANNIHKHPRKDVFNTFVLDTFKNLSKQKTFKGSIFYGLTLTSQPKSIKLKPKTIDNTFSYNGAMSKNQMLRHFRKYFLDHYNVSEEDLKHMFANGQIAIVFRYPCHIDYDASFKLIDNLTKIECLKKKE